MPELVLVMAQEGRFVGFVRARGLSRGNGLLERVRDGLDLAQERRPPPRVVQCAVIDQAEHRSPARDTDALFVALDELSEGRDPFGAIVVGAGAGKRDRQCLKAVGSGDVKPVGAIGPDGDDVSRRQQAPVSKVRGTSEHQQYRVERGGALDDLAFATLDPRERHPRFSGQQRL